MLATGLFGFLHTMTTARHHDESAVAVAKVEFVRLRHETEIEEKKREKPQRIKPEQAPVLPAMQIAKDQAPNLALDVTAIAAGLGAEFGSAGGGGGDGRGVPGGLGIGGGMSDRGALPLVRVEPQYPPEAAKRKLEGWVQLRFTITKAGTVDAVQIVKSSNSLFENAAVAAVRKWKYEPQMQSGAAVESAGVDVVLRFRMES
jgi:protein TonB